MHYVEKTKNRRRKEMKRRKRKKRKRKHTVQNNVNKINGDR